MKLPLLSLVSDVIRYETIALIHKELTMPKIFELGPRPIYGNRGGMFVAQSVEVSSPTPQSTGGQNIIGKECQSIADFEDQVEQMKSELDQLVVEARKRFSAL